MELTLLREFSAAGPCIRMGGILREDKNWWYIVPLNGEIRVSKISKHSRKAQNGSVHAEACRSCRDHAETQYPEGYMD
jgi:hypothetical protein